VTPEKFAAKPFNEFAAGPVRWSGWPLARLEYTEWHAPYDESDLDSSGFEQGYRLPHWSDHEWPERDWDGNTITERCGPYIGGQKLKARPPGQPLSYHSRRYS
jgi:hypothetical protein